MNLVDFDVPVRELAEFVHRRGNLGGNGQFQRADRALEGTRGHQRLQRSRGDNYQSEVPIECLFTQSDVNLRVVGRIDGLVEGRDPIVEEIKTVDSSWSRQADEVHLAQLKIYAGLLVLKKEWSHVSMRLTYLDLATDEITGFSYNATAEELLSFLNETVKEWFSWLLPHIEWIKKRDVSIKEMPFPFTHFRTGQRELARSIYRSIREKENLFIEAPTGMGKTLATLFPAVKSLPLLDDGKIFYITAKTPGRLAANDALERLRQNGLHVRSLSLTAKSKICFANAPMGCDLKTCPFALGYYDRVKQAMRELLEAERLDQDHITTIAQNHQICPYQLSLDVSVWADVIIGDYNYVFDPAVMLQRYFGVGKPKHVVLVDEAHNLVDRSRDMYSATLEINQLIIQANASAGKGSGRARSSLARARKEFQEFLDAPRDNVIAEKSHHDGAVATSELPKEFISRLRSASRAIEEYLLARPPSDNLSPWLEPLFVIYQFLRISENFDESYRVIIDPKNQQITLYCVNPSKRLSETLKGLRSTIFFSATLSPVDYFMDVLGGSSDDKNGRFASPFRSEQMKIQIAPFDVSFQGRDQSLDSVAQAVKEHLVKAPGNHLIYCPSLRYLEQLYGKLTELGVHATIQTPAMDESARTKFLEKFTQGTSSIGLAVLGGIFAEGIDLPGKQLIGVTIIGVGLPGLSIERDLLKAYYDGVGKSGFDYAYQYPGMQRVLQAVGRLIRSEEDQGVVLLIDRRFLETRYARLLPSWWKIDRNYESTSA